MRMDLGDGYRKPQTWPDGPYDGAIPSLLPPTNVLALNTQYDGRRFVTPPAGWAAGHLSSHPTNNPLHPSQDPNPKPPKVPLHPPPSISQATPKKPTDTPSCSKPPPHTDRRSENLWISVTTIGGVVIEFSRPSIHFVLQ